jgi:hypothetical protein
MNGKKEKNKIISSSPLHTKTQDSVVARYTGVELAQVSVNKEVKYYISRH